MPIPRPRQNETKNIFISRCMGNPSMRKDYPEQKKRAGVCYAQWRDAEKQEAESLKVETRKDRTGKTVTIFNSFKGLSGLLKAEESGEKKEMSNKNRVGPIVVMEAFVSLRQAIEVELANSGLGKAYLVDFSNKEVVYNKYDGDTGQDHYFKRAYKVVSGKVEFDGTPETVDRKVTYEGADLDTSALVEITDRNLQVKKHEQ